MALKGAMAAFFSAAGAFLGWQGVMALVWVAAMGLDYLTGTLAACKQGQWNSGSARDGLWHKGGMIAVVAAGAITDGTLSVVCENLPLEMDWPVVVLPLVLAWYIITELGSILENAVKMGAPVPPWLTDLLKAGRKAVEDAAGGGE